MSKSSINLNKIIKNFPLLNEERHLIEEKVNFEENFIHFNFFSFENYSNKNNKSELDLDLKKIDFIDDKNEENNEIQSILSDLNKNIEINIKENEIENKNYNECQEILNILKKPLSDKNITFHYSPFKPLLEPKKISMVGKVFYNIPKDEIVNTNSIATQNSSNNSNINNIKNL